MLVKVGGDQLKPYIESLPADHPDRSEMLELVAEPGIDVFARIAKHPKAVNQREGMMPNPITIHHVKALLVQSRGRFGQPSHKLNYICNVCQAKECEKNGPTHAMPFEDCIHGAGFFGGKCGNCLWNNEQRACIRHKIFPGLTGVLNEPGLPSVTAGWEGLKGPGEVTEDICKEEESVGSGSGAMKCAVQRGSGITQVYSPFPYTRMIHGRALLAWTAKLRKPRSAAGWRMLRIYVS